MVKFIFKIALFLAGFAALAAVAGNKGARRQAYPRTVSDEQFRIKHVKSTNEQLNNIEYISHILQERANNETCLIYHGTKEKCVLCGFLDSPELEIDGIAYEHNYRIADNNKYHFVIQKSANKTDELN